MKKSMFLSLLLTIAFLVLFNGAYMKFAPFSFDINVFVIIASILFMVIYKSVSYLSKLKKVEKHSKSAIIFVTAFFVILFIPMMNITEEEYNEKENRKLAEYVPLVAKEGKINTSFGRNFEKWFNDRFWGRNKVIKRYNKFKRKINREVRLNDNVIRGDNGFYFYSSNFDVFKDIPQEKLAEYRKDILRLKKFCDDNNIKLYFTIAPSKEDIYDNYHRVKINRDNNNGLQLIEYMQGEKIDIIYTRDSLYEKRDDDMLFFKTDNHWTEKGAFLAYQEITNIVKRDYPDIKVLKESDLEPTYKNAVRFDFDERFFKGGLIDLKAKMPIPEYKYYDINGIKLENVKVDNDRGVKSFHNPKGANYRVILIGDSMGDQLTKFFAATFKDFMRIRTNYGEHFTKDAFLMSRFEQDIIDFETDILILNLASIGMHHLENMYKD